MAWDWQTFCKETTTGEVMASCFGKGGDQTYLNWIVSAWGWTLTVALSALVVALACGLVVGTLRTLPNSPGWCAWALPGWSCFTTSRCWCKSFSGTLCCPP